MIDSKVEFAAKPKPVLKAAEKANFENLGHAAASIRKDAVKSIKRRKKPSRPGQPPHTHKGNFYRRAIRFDVDRKAEDALIGFQFSVIGDVGHAHEFGATRGGVDFPERPTLGPALERGAPRLGNHWKGTIGV